MTATTTLDEERPPDPGTCLLHPELPGSVLRLLAHPERPLWTPRELRDLTDTVRRTLGPALTGLLRYEPDQRWWARLALTSGVELWVLTWLPGQGTAPHDHNGAAGSFSVLTGAVEEEYRYPGQPVRRTVHPSGHSIGFGTDRAHRVGNTGAGPAATVHAYSPPLLPTREYGSLLDAHR